MMLIAIHRRRSSIDLHDVGWRWFHDGDEVRDHPRALFTIGGISGVMHASPPADLQQTDTYFIVAHFHYVLVAGSMMGLFAGVYYYFPKFTGRMLDEKLGSWHFWLFFIGVNLTFFPMHFSGLYGCRDASTATTSGRGGSRSIS
jgi:heme/copper-type cytochrome/quinol oxidase subunit 1